MLIALRALNTRGEFQDFSCQPESLELALDVVSSLAAQGNRLLEVVLIEQGSTTPLPLDAFDGQSFSALIQALEQEWQLALKGSASDPCSGSIHSGKGASNESTATKPPSSNWSKP